MRRSRRKPSPTWRHQDHLGAVGQVGRRPPPRRRPPRPASELPGVSGADAPVDAELDQARPGQDRTPCRRATRADGARPARRRYGARQRPAAPDHLTAASRVELILLGDAGIVAVTSASGGDRPSASASRAAAARTSRYRRSRSQQVLVGAVGDHPAVVDQHHPVGQGDGGRPVGDHDGRAVAHDLGRGRRGSRAPWWGRPPRWRRRGSAPGGRPGWPGRWRCAGAGRPTASSPARRSRCRSPLGSSAMNSWAPASRAARSMSSIGAFGSAKAMLAAMVSLNRKVSSNTRPTARRTVADGGRRARRRRRCGTAPASTS